MTTERDILPPPQLPGLILQNNSPNRVLMWMSRMKKVKHHSFLPSSFRNRFEPL